MSKKWLINLAFLASVHSLTISPSEAMLLGEKIWKNECNATIDGLTSWNSGENFASLGIGHFIWYPQGKKERFQETFPLLLAYLEEEKIPLAPWLKEAGGCLWNSQEEFLQNFQSPKMQQLRQFLFETKNHQALFIAKRLDEVLPQILEKCPQYEREKVTGCFQRLASEANGLYALVHYLNFKGVGLLASETYQGQGWGLLQVLQRMPANSEAPLLDFTEAARALLTERVKNSPPERGEGRWLKGWSNRLDTYLK